MKISIITATYNSAHTIADCINSVFNQNYKNIEHIIIDGASKDNTLEIINSIPNRVSKILSEPDNGIYDAMNKGIELATGDIIGMLNSDDLGRYINDEVISTIINEFEHDNLLQAIHTNLYYVSSGDINQIVRHWKTGEYIRGSFFKGSAPCTPNSFFKKRGLFKIWIIQP